MLGGWLGCPLVPSQYFESNFEVVPASDLGGRLGRSAPSPYSLELGVEPTGGAETSILGWEREFVECSISDAEVIAEDREVDAGGLRTKEIKTRLQRCTF